MRTYGSTGAMMRARGKERTRVRGGGGVHGRVSSRGMVVRESWGTGVVAYVSVSVRGRSMREWGRGCVSARVHVNAETRARMRVRVRARVGGGEDGEGGERKGAGRGRGERQEGGRVVGGNSECMG